MTSEFIVFLQCHQIYFNPLNAIAISLKLTPLVLFKVNLYNVTKIYIDSFNATRNWFDLFNF
jgi:hypothetical protein